MVEEVENFSAKCDSQPIGRLHVLQDRKVRIVESRPDDHIPAKTAETHTGSEYRGIEPAIYATHNCDRPRHVRPQRVRHASDRAVRSHDVDGVAALRLHNRGDLPTRYQPIASEGQVIDATNHDTLARIEAR